MSHQRDRERDRTPARTTSHDDDLAPGRGTPSSQLTAPTNPIVSGLIRRKADGPAGDAESAVGAASASSGNALPVTLQRKFEASLGTTLDGVRVHTGAESATAAAAVGARAYALGQDIHFARGAYDPSSPAGEHLLAHEVAHTVQQRGGSPMRQNKLEVSSPHDHAEHEADRAADAMVGGERFAIGSAGGAIQREADASMDEAARDEAMKGIELWRKRANQCVLASCNWYGTNMGKYLSLTSSNPNLAWTETKVFSALSAAVGFTVKNATKLTIEAMAAMIGGPPGVTAALVSVVGSVLTSAIMNAIKGTSQVAARNAAAAGGEVTAAWKQALANAMASQDNVEKVADRAKQRLHDAKSTADVVAVRDWSVGELSAAKPIPDGDLSLFERMYGDWLLEHASVDRLPIPGISSGSGVDKGQWNNARRDATKVDGKGVEQHLDLFGYQTRGFLSRIGVEADWGDEMIAAARGAKASDAGALMAKFDDKSRTFTMADPAKLVPFLSAYIDPMTASDPKTVEDMREGRIQLEVTPKMSIIASGQSGAGLDQSGEAGGAIGVTSFTVIAVLPDRQTFQSQDPMDAGRPPVDFGSGKPKRYRIHAST